MSAIYYNPSPYLNGTEPLNVTGYINHCNWQGEACDSSTPIANGTGRNSFLWFDELHPSEQTDRIIAREFVKMIRGSTTWATFWNDTREDGNFGTSWGGGADEEP